jgi:hypothetical protein
MDVSWLSLSVCVRGLLAVGGVVLFLLSWPVTRGSLLFERTGGLYAKVRENKPYTLTEVQAGIRTINAAIAADPMAFRFMDRSELLGAVAANRALKVSDEQRRVWQRQAKADLIVGLGNDPARTLDWQRLAIIYEWLDGASRDIPPILLMSIDTGPMMSPLWPARLRIILDNWGYFTDQEKARLGNYVVMMWRRTDDRRWFGYSVYNPIDEVILRYMLGHEPKAQEELTKWIEYARKTK